MAGKCNPAVRVWSVSCDYLSWERFSKVQVGGSVFIVRYITQGLTKDCEREKIPSYNLWPNQVSPSAHFVSDNMCNAFNVAPNNNDNDLYMQLQLVC